MNSMRKKQKKMHEHQWDLHPHIKGFKYCTECPVGREMRKEEQLPPLGKKSWHVDKQVSERSSSVPTTPSGQRKSGKETTIPVKSAEGEENPHQASTPTTESEEESKAHDSSSITESPSAPPATSSTTSSQLIVPQKPSELGSTTSTPKESKD